MKIKSFYMIILIPLLVSTLMLVFPLHFVEAQGQTLYVDDDNISGPWDGSLVNPYQNISSGLENALAGDTVFVYDGLYLEHINVTKSVSLIGLNPATTILDGNGEMYLPIVNINASNLNLEVQLDHDSANPDSVQVGDGVATLEIPAAGEATTFDATSHAKLDLVEAPPAEIAVKSFPTTGAEGMYPQATISSP